LEYKAIHADWEITMGCNMRCRHCGSSCHKPLSGQLTTSEALRLCDDIGKLGLKSITLTGGEPLTRPDWHYIADRLQENGVTTDIMTNGWLLTEQLLDQANAVGVDGFIISLDGDREVHDIMRRQGSYGRVINALEIIEQKGIRAEVITTVHRINFHNLSKIRKTLSEYNVKTWRINLALPMGNFAKHSDKILETPQFNEVVDFINESISDDQITILPGDCFGYYSHKDSAVRKKSNGTRQSQAWQGCDAGKRGFGILHNGDIIGCYYIRDKRFVEGNVREVPLSDIWNSKTSFAWNRVAVNGKLAGLCGVCKYGDTCFGGCANLRLTMNGNVLSENRYCSYNQALFQAWQKVESITDVEILASMGKDFVKQGELQLAHMLLQKALTFHPDDIELLNYFSYTCYLLHHYTAAQEASERALVMDPDNVYANEGMGVIFAKQGDLKKGVNHLCKAAKHTTNNYMTPYYDLIVILAESGRLQSALKVIQQAEIKAPGFKRKYLRGNIANLHAK